MAPLNNWSDSIKKYLCCSTCVLVYELIENNTFLYVTAKCAEILWGKTTFEMKDLTYRGTMF